MAKSVQASLAKYKKNAGQAGDAYLEGVSGVTTAPTHQAAAAVDRYARGVQDAVSSGAYVNGCMGVSLGDWQQAVVAKGKSNYLTGVSKLSNKATKNMTDLLTYTAQVKQEIASMPNDTEADRKARMDAAYEKMKAYKKR